MNMWSKPTMIGTKNSISAAVSFASKTDYRHDVRRPTELNWNKSNSYKELQDQWCLDYMQRSRDCRGSGVGCFVLAGVLRGCEPPTRGCEPLPMIVCQEFACHQHFPEQTIWLEARMTRLQQE
ncbi:Hypothetical predicted protein, partial [Paramuricea clavata]